MDQRGGFLGDDTMTEEASVKEEISKPLRGTARFKEWNDTRKRRAAMKLFLKLYQDPKSTMQGILNEAAYKMAREMFMRMLDNEGFMHCRMCPIRGPLKKLTDQGNVMMCDVHYKMAMEAKENLKNPTKPTEDKTNGKNRDEGRQAAAHPNRPAHPGAV